MTSSVDTAQTPRVRRVVSGPVAPVLTPHRPAAAPVVEREPVPVPPISPCESRAERRAARRQRRRYALLGLGVLAAALAATVSVLDVIR